MDWPMEEATWTNHDLRIFDFQARPTVILQKLESDATLIKHVLLDKNGWENWFDDASSTIARGNGLYIVLSNRAEPIFEGEDAPVSYVSVTRDTWERITRFFHVHRSITRSITRQVACFSSVYEEESKRTNSKICFTARMSKYLPGDLALSATYVPSNESTFAVVYGCDEDQMQEIEKLVRLAGDKTKYPLLVIEIFAELERRRLVSMADQLLDGFTLRSEHLENGKWDPSTDMSSDKAQECLALCVQSRNLIDHMRAVKRQLLKLLVEIDEFGNHFASHKSEAHHNHSNKVRRFKKAGFQMKKRLQDTINEYDDKMDECNMIVGNTTLAMQTVWNHIARHDSGLNTKIARANTLVAMEAKREGNQMKLIALLTMVYLPFSSVAAIFSMDLFDWNAQAGEPVVSKYIWVFVAIAVGLTAITFFVWYRITRRHGNTTDEDAPERHSKMV
ncbi:hypothetical protein F4677DRAFT_430786 [Hypoxylon crocopeplum]|nr:hypothetical protein F4677DRAFT_430786 [Hypoxylon crocopeplum]